MHISNVNTLLLERGSFSSMIFYDMDNHLLSSLIVYLLVRKDMKQLACAHFNSFSLIIALTSCLTLGRITSVS
jgi:hypothetical protein